MPIPIVSNPIPQFRGPDGGDIGRAFLNSFFASRNEVRSQQDQAMQMEQNQYNRDVMRPLQEESMRLGLSERRQGMSFAAEDQSMERSTFDFNQTLRPLGVAQQTNQVISGAYQVQQQEAALVADTTKKALEMQNLAQLNENLGVLSTFGQVQPIAPGTSATPTSSRAVFPGAPVPVGMPLTNPDGSRGTLQQSAPSSLLPPIDWQTNPVAVPPVAAPPATAVPLAPASPPATPTAPVAPSAPGTYADQFKAQVAHVQKQLASYDAVQRSLQFLPDNSPVKLSAMMAVAKLQADPTFGAILKHRESEKQNALIGQAAANAVKAAPAAVNRAFPVAYPQFVGYDTALMPDGTYDIVKRSADGKALPVSLPDKAAFVDAYTNYTKNFKPMEQDGIAATLLKDYARHQSIAASASAIDPSMPSEEQAKIRTQAAGAKAAMTALEAIDPTLKNYRNELTAAAELQKQQNKVASGQDQQKEQPAKKTLDASFPTAAQTAKAEAQKSEQQKTLESITKYAPAIERVFPDNTKLPDNANPALQIAAKVVRNESSRFTRDGRELTQDEKGQWNWTGDHVDRSYALHVAEKAGLVTSEAGAGERARAIATVEAWAKHKLEVEHGYDLSTAKKGAAAANNLTPEQIQAAAAEMRKAAGG